jgi:hypothetical protein
MTKRRKPTPWEEREQKSFVRWIAQEHPELKIHHSPNGGERHMLVAKSLKEMGTSRGFPDMLVFCRKTKRALAIEFKARPPHASPVSEEQREWLELLGDLGFHNHVCHGVAEATRLVDALFGAAP